MKTFLTAVSTVVGFLVCFIGVILYSCWANAFVAVKLWTWFVASTFGLPLLTLPIAFGIGLLVRLWTHQTTSNHCKDERSSTEKITALVTVLLAPWITFLVGWVCKSMFM